MISSYHDTQAGIAVDRFIFRA